MTKKYAALLAGLLLSTGAAYAFADSEAPLSQTSDNWSSSGNPMPSASTSSLPTATS